MRYAYEIESAPDGFDQRADRIVVDLEPLKLPTPHVVPVADADLPPIPHKGEQANPFHYQSLILDLDTGALSFHCEDWRQEERDDRDHLWYWISANPLQRSYAKTVPTLRKLLWVVDTGTMFVPYMTAAEGNALAERALPYARTLAAGLLQVDGTDGLDFTAAAAVAGAEIDRLCETPALFDALPPERRGAPLQHDLRTEPRRVFDAADLLTQEALAKSFGRIDITQATEEELMDRSEWLGKTLGRQVPGGAHPEAGGMSLVDVVGVRAVVFALRSKLAEGRRPIDAAEWFARHPGPLERLTTSATESDLERIAADAQAEATLAGVQITGAAMHLIKLRTKKRALLRSELEGSGSEVKRLERELAAQRAHRAGLILSILSWEEGDSDADLGRAAQMTRQAVQQLRERAMGAEEEQ